MDIIDSASQELYFQKIQELILDDDKVVTVSSLASDLAISLQNSRNLISKYVEDQRKLKPGEFAVTYVISGTLKDGGKKGVFLVKEDALKEKRNLFNSSTHEIIYSVQKNKNVDFNIIGLVDMFNSTNIRETALHGSIVSKNCIKRTLKFKKLPSPPPPTLKGKSSVFAPKAAATTSSEKAPVAPKTELKAKTSGGIADLFKAAASKPKSGNSSATGKQIKPTKSGGLTGFLTNGALKLPKATNNNETKKEKIELRCGSSNSESRNSIKEGEALKLPKAANNNETKREDIDSGCGISNSESQNSVKEEILDIVDVDFDEEPMELVEESKTVKKDESAKKNTERKNKGSENQKASKRRRDKSKELPSKKRKRIIERNDSDSDDLFEKEDSIDDIIDKSDEEPERVPSPVVQKPLLPKNKKRKAVERNYEDEEGFIVTKMEYIYETASEDENENIEPEPSKQEKKEEKRVPKPKVVEKKKPSKNQATLMNFFKRK